MAGATRPQKELAEYVASQQAASTRAQDLPHGGKAKSTKRSTELAHLRWRSADLEAQVSRLTQANRALTCFVAEAAHELIEPMIILESSAILLKQELGGSLDALSSSRLDSFGSVAARSRLLVESLLLEARSAERPVEFRSTDLGTIVDHALRLVPADAGGPAPPITVSPLPTIDTNPELISIVMRNLLANAVKYGDPRGGEITLTADRTRAGWRLSVVSPGRSISVSDAQRLLRRFERGAESRSQGTGLGLAICVRIVERLGGTLGVLPESGGGNRFFVELPQTG